MRFCEKDADFPVFEVGSTVTYQTPRRAMAVERMLLRLAAELDAKAAERELPLAELFAERLCVPHAAALMDPCFADMRQQGLLVVEPALGGFDAVTLADVQVDPQRGRQLLETGKLPGRTQMMLAFHVYDPIRRTLAVLDLRKDDYLLTGSVERLGERIGEAPRSQAPDRPRADAGRFAALNLSADVRAALIRERYDWLKEGTEIEGVDTLLSSHAWKTRKVQVDLDLSGRVSLSVPTCKATENWLRALPAEELWQEILAPMFGTQRRPGLPPPILTASCSIQPQGSPSIAEDVQGKTAVVVRPSEALPTLGDVPAGQLQVWLAKELVADRVVWSAHQRGATLVVGGADFDQEFVALVRRSGGQVELQTDHILLLHIQDLTRLAEVRVVETGPTARQTWDGVAEDLMVIAKKSGHPQDLAVLAAWQPADQVLLAWEQKIAGTGIHALSEAAAQLRLRMEGIAGQAVPAAVWEEVMVRCARQALQQEPDGQQPQAVVKLLESLQQLGQRVTLELEDDLLAKVRPLTSADELRLLRTGLPSKRLPSTEQFFSHTVAAELVQEALARKPCLSDQSPLERAAKAARLAADAVAKLAGCELGTLAGEDAMAKTLPKLEPAILGQLDQWATAVGHLRKLLDGNPASGSRLEVIDTQFRDYRSFLDRLAKGDASKTPLVFDTNVFLHHPKVLADLRSNQVAVVPQQVVAELDRKKRDPQLVEAATQANADIHRRREQIQFEEGDLQLLPAAYRSTADDQILSVAMRLKWRKAVLVTSDKNLQSKAKSLGLEARTPAELWPARKSQPAQGAKAK